MSKTLILVIFLNCVSIIFINCQSQFPKEKIQYAIGEIFSDSSNLGLDHNLKISIEHNLYEKKQLTIFQDGKIASYFQENESQSSITYGTYFSFNTFQVKKEFK